MIKTLVLQIEFQDLHVHSEQQLQAFIDRFRERCFPMHPDRETNSSVELYLIACLDLSDQTSAPACVQA